MKIKAAPCLCITVILFHTCCVPARSILRLKNSLFPANNREIGFCLEFSSLSCRDFLFKSLRWLVTARTFATQAQWVILLMNMSDFCLQHLASLTHMHTHTYKHTHTPTVNSQVLKEKKRTSSPPSYLHLGSFIWERKRMRNIRSHISALKGQSYLLSVRNVVIYRGWEVHVMLGNAVYFTLFLQLWNTGPSRQVRLNTFITGLFLSSAMSWDNPQCT